MMCSAGFGWLGRARLAYLNWSVCRPRGQGIDLQSFLKNVLLYWSRLIKMYEIKIHIKRQEST